MAVGAPREPSHEGVFGYARGVAGECGVVGCPERPDAAVGAPDPEDGLTLAGASVHQVDVSEPAGVIRLFRVIAPAGTRVKVTGVIPGVAGVSVSLPIHSRAAAPETCSRHGGTVGCAVAEEACPMPEATWRFKVRKMAGPAGRIRVDFVVGPEHSA